MDEIKNEVLTGEVEEVTKIEPAVEASDSNVDPLTVAIGAAAIFGVVSAIKLGINGAKKAKDWIVAKKAAKDLECLQEDEEVTLEEDDPSEEEAPQTKESKK